ncbi:hypothetical protein, partial [Streptomyces canus]|uniref:hypothetical protein n=1 Tax=Streptomyces canus TaxID=58343 RepID=UPI0037143271
LPPRHGHTPQNDGITYTSTVPQKDHSARNPKCRLPVRWQDSTASGIRNHHHTYDHDLGDPEVGSGATSVVRK